MIKTAFKGQDRLKRLSRKHAHEGEPNLALLKWRLVLAAFIVMATIVMHNLKPGGIMDTSLLACLGFVFITLAVSWAACMGGAPRTFLLISQILADVVSIGLLVSFSGGAASIFPLFFCVPIVLAAYHLGPRWSMIVAGIAAVLTGGSYFGQTMGWLVTSQQTPGLEPWGWPVLFAALHMMNFIIVAGICGSLARRFATKDKHQKYNLRQVKMARLEVRNILDNILSGLISVDTKGLITRVNPACCEILKLREKQLVGRDICQVMAGGMEDFAESILSVAQGADSLQRGEVKVTCQGREIPLGMSVNHVVGSQGRILGSIAIFTDLTETKEMTTRMREADRLAAIGELAASIAHEIKNPLASLRGSVEILAGDLELSEDNELLFGLVLKESARINGIINDFLSYSRMRSPVMVPILAREFRDELRLQIKQHIAAKGGLIRSTFEVIPEELEIIADPDQLTQMTLNLVINACEAMEHQGNLRISLVAMGSQDFCELSVADDGPGIDEDIRESLFEPFKTNKVTGTGLGLSIVSRIANAHGGKVWAEDTPGGGATFRVRLSTKPPTMQNTTSDLEYMAAQEKQDMEEEPLLTP